MGISLEEMERETMAPTCQAYTDFLVRTAATGTFAETIAALRRFRNAGRGKGRFVAGGEPANPG